MATYIRYARSGFEFEVAKEVARRGFVVSVLGLKYIQRTGRGATRSTEVFEKPALPNILFVEMESQDHSRLEHIRGLAGTFDILPDVARRDVVRFRTLIDTQNEGVIREFNLSGAATPLFPEGAQVELTEGPFKDFVGKFLGMVKSGDEHLCEVETDAVNLRVPMDQLRAAQ